MSLLEEMEAKLAARPKPEKICACGKTFIVQRQWQKFCCQTCRLKFHTLSKKIASDAKPV